MPLGGQCYEEGPFFPTTPRYAVQVGIAKKQDLLLKPDWTAVFGVITGLLTLLITFVVLTVSKRYKQQQKKSFLKEYYKTSHNKPHTKNCPSLISFFSRHSCGFLFFTAYSDISPQGHNISEIGCAIS